MVYYIILYYTRPHIDRPKRSASRDFARRSIAKTRKTEREGGGAISLDI